MGKYQIMTLAVRCHIFALLQEGKTQSEIAKKVGYHKSTISRELKRFGKGKYKPEAAQVKLKVRLRKRGRQRVLEGDLLDNLKKNLKKGWSPEQVMERLKLEGKDYCSVQTVYNFIHKNVKKPDLLHFHLRKYNKRGIRQYRGRKRMCFKNPHTLPIKTRPDIINNRTRIGDWERDGLYIAEKDQLLALVERKARLTKLIFMGRHSNEKVVNLTAQVFQQIEHKPLSITQDNGPEFRGLSKEPFERYNCEPLRPDQRGSVENTIGLIRQYVKRKTKRIELNDSKIKEIEDRLNNRPRKILGYKTPYEVFYKKVALLT